MGGAICVGLVAFRWSTAKGRTLLNGPLHIPSNTAINKRLVLGSLVFGVGWGIAGFCPGPAIVSLGAGQIKAGVFVAAMMGGMALFEVLEAYRRKRLK